MGIEQEKLRGDKANLANALREKARKHQQTHELYERLKRKEMATATQNAAYDTADDVLQHAGPQQHEPNAPIGPTALYNLQPRAGSDGSFDPTGRMRPPPRIAPALGGRAVHSSGSQALKLCTFPGSRL